MIEIAVQLNRRNRYSNENNRITKNVGGKAIRLLGTKNFQQNSLCGSGYLDPDWCHLPWYIRRHGIQRTQVWFQLWRSEKWKHQSRPGKMLREIREAIQQIRFSCLWLRNHEFRPYYICMCYLLPNSKTYSQSTVAKHSWRWFRGTVARPRERIINRIQAFYRLLLSTIHQTCFRSSFHHPTNSVGLSFKVFLQVSL